MKRKSRTARVTYISRNGLQKYLWEV